MGSMLHDAMELVQLRQKGQGMVEYALILVLVSVVAILVLTAIGTNIQSVFGQAANALNP